MFSCKDCVHYEVCGRRSYIAEYQGGELAHRNNVCCQAFKNKADFVKIPCRCKDCDHFNNYNPGRTYCEEHSDGWGDSIVYVDEDDYCSFGIRRKEGADNG